MKDLVTVPLPFLKQTDELKTEELKNSVLREAPDLYISAQNMIFDAPAGNDAKTLGTPTVSGETMLPTSCRARAFSE